jgi:hypothetical protein
VPLELDLFCDFVGKSYFQTVFGGTNQKRMKMAPKIGHSYLREIILDSEPRAIKYRLTDLKEGKSEKIILTANDLIGTGKDERPMGGYSVASLGRAYGAFHS